MHFILIAPPDDDIVFDAPANRNYQRDAVGQQLDRLSRIGHTIVTAPVTDDARAQAYGIAAAYASRLGIQISRVFGSRHHSGVDHFGREVPALLVYESENGALVDVYPHSHRRDSVDTPILEYLASLSLSGGVK